MYTKNIGESNINVTLHETYQNSVLDFSCNYSPNDFNTIITDTPNYDKNDREIKKLIENDYKLSVIYSKYKKYKLRFKNYNKRKVMKQSVP